MLSAHPLTGVDVEGGGKGEGKVVEDGDPRYEESMRVQTNA
jgi:hypothetical protein